METAQENTQSFITTNDDSDTLDFKKLISIFLQFWPLFLASLFICFLISFLYLRYSTPLYKINSKILIKDDNNGSMGSSPDLLNQLNVFNTKNNVNNEKEVLATHYLIEKVVNELQLNISYFIVGNIKSTELYKNCPFQFKIIFLKDSISTKTFNLKFNGTNPVFTLKGDSINATYHLNDTIKTADLSFVVLPTGVNSWKNNSYQVTISTPNDVTAKYLQNLNFDITDKQASVIAITLQETVPQKGEDILNKLYEVYTRMNEEDKNKISDSTISFINTRLAIVEEELSGVENKLEKFKVQNQLSTDLPEQSRLVLNNASDVQQQLTMQDVQISVVKSIEDNLKGNSPRIVPNAGVIQDPTYISTVQAYNTLVLERDRQLETTKPDNPVVQNLNSQIDAVKKNLTISLENIKKEMQISRDELANKNTEFLGQIKSGPSKERAFLDISRQQDVKQQLYLYLLQKREETAISRSGTLANSRLIEPGKSDTKPYTPKKSLIYMVALCAGILLPWAGIYLKNTLNNKVTSSLDISRETKVPVLGEIGHNTTNKAIVVEQNSRTALAEQFRAIRTNLQFLLKGKEHQVIMITSSTSGEGKSFLSINLGLSLAISNKKVVLVELDLRKPKISKELNLPKETGFTDYLISKYKKEEILKQTPHHPNLYLISSGTIPPNPAELILDNEVNGLFAWLRTQFDYIIVDTPPAGVVIDPVLIGKYADASIYVVRQGYTLKGQLQILNDFKQHARLPNLSILINDVRLDKSYGYGYKYGYHYGYGYNSDYYSDSKKPKKNFFKKATDKSS